MTEDQDVNKMIELGERMKDSSISGFDEYLIQKGEVVLLELEVKELEARLKLRRLKAELDRDPAKEQKEFIDGLFDRNTCTPTTVEWSERLSS